MTPPLTDRKDEELDRMLAKLDGWTEERIELASKLAKATSEYRRLPRKDSFSGWALADKIEALERKGAGPIPRYTQSLDECARVEAGLTKEQRGEYSERYLPFYSGAETREQGPIDLFVLATAKPRQRTIALISTLQAKP